MWLNTVIQDNLCRWKPGTKSGHAESFFMKLNDPAAARALWLKFTILAPKKRPQATVGQVWAIWFDLEKGERLVIRETYPIDGCELWQEGRARVKMGPSHFEEDQTVGILETPEHAIGWDLAYDSTNRSLRLLPQDWMYSSPLPKTKLTTPNPDLRMRGRFHINGVRYEVDGWPAMQGHNWGVEHPLFYAWWQCNFFGEENTFFEGASSKVKVGPWETRVMTLCHLRYKGEDIPLNSLKQARSNTTKMGDYHASFEASQGPWKVIGRVETERDHLVALPYTDPKGDLLYCLNSKLATMKLDLFRDGSKVDTLEAPRRAALELGVRDGDHGVPFVIPSGLSWEGRTAKVTQGPASPIEVVSGAYPVPAGVGG